MVEAAMGICNTLQHNATLWTHSTHCNALDTLHHTATHCNTLQHTDIYLFFPRCKSLPIWWWRRLRAFGNCLHTTFRVCSSAWLPQECHICHLTSTLKCSEGVNCIYLLFVVYYSCMIDLLMYCLFWICSCLFRFGFWVSMGWLRLVGSLKLLVSFSKEPYNLVVDVLFVLNLFLFV